jgi:CheY-like chemotaxis protein
MTPEPTNDIPVLLVEDNELDVEITRRVIARSGVRVRLSVARDGQEALDVMTGAAQSQSTHRPTAAAPKLVLLDLRLPMVDGIDVLRTMKSDPRLCMIPVVVLTGAISERPMRQCLEGGASMYLVKPITAEEAIGVVETIEKYWEAVGRMLRGAAWSRSSGEDEEEAER